MYHDGDTVREVIQRGAMGFIPKVCSKEIILGALRLVPVRSGLRAVASNG